MLKNYLKLAFKVLSRNKLYTAISLFGISFTLAILMLSAAFIDNELGKNAPLSKMDRILTVPTLRMVKWEREIDERIDSTLVDGSYVYDTVRSEKILRGDPSNHASQTNSGVGYRFYENELKDLDNIEVSSVFDSYGRLDLYPNNKKMSVSATYVDENYFKIFDFQFIEGVPFTKSSVENQEQVIVLNQKTAKAYFGKQDSYLGKELVHKNKGYKVIGVVKDVNASSTFISGDAFLPYTFLPASSLNSGFGHFGGLHVAFLLNNASNMDRLKKDFRQIEATIDNSLVDGDFDDLIIREFSIREAYARNLIQNYEKSNNAKILFTLIGIGLFLFTLIPMLNLINLNTTRILERSAEIGVRKSFGAKSSDLMVQFVFENIVLTLIGGLIGLAITFLAINLLNQSGILGKSTLSFSPKLFFTSLLIVILFGILSGLVPAWRTSKTTIAQAIKTNAI